MLGANRSKLWFGLSLSAVALLAGLIAFRAQQRRAEQEDGFAYERLPRALAPDIRFGKAGGPSQQLGELRGQVVLLHLWATWCPPCRKELPALLEFGRELAASGIVRLVALSTESEWEPIVRYFSGNVPGEVFFDASGEATETYQPNLIPETYLIGADGVLRLRFSGPADWSDPRVREAVLQASRPR